MRRVRAASRACHGQSRREVAQPAPEAPRACRPPPCGRSRDLPYRLTATDPNPRTDTHRADPNSPYRHAQTAESERAETGSRRYPGAPVQEVGDIPAHRYRKSEISRRVGTGSRRYPGASVPGSRRYPGASVQEVGDIPAHRYRRWPAGPPSQVVATSPVGIARPAAGVASRRAVSRHTSRTLGQLSRRTSSAARARPIDGWAGTRWSDKSTFVRGPVNPSRGQTAERCTESDPARGTVLDQLLATPSIHLWCTDRFNSPGVRRIEAGGGSLTACRSGKWDDPL
jgi:hypothetical protein